FGKLAGNVLVVATSEHHRATGQDTSPVVGRTLFQHHELAAIVVPNVGRSPVGSCDPHQVVQERGEALGGVRRQRLTGTLGQENEVHVEVSRVALIPG